MNVPRSGPVRSASAAALLVAGMGSAWAQGLARDPAAAEREYRIARRLGAEGSAEAAAALARVVALDPVGPWADDALVDQAMLEGLPSWPDSMGTVPEEALRRAAPLLERVASALPASDRALEARYRAALLKLEPVVGRDLAKARAELLALAAAGEDTRWSRAARYALGWLDEQEGAHERAYGAYLRLLVDHPASEASALAARGAGRVALRRGAFGPAAALLQEALDATGSPEPDVAALRDCAVRNLRRAAFEAARWSSATPTKWNAGVKSALAAVALPDGDVLVADRRAGAIVRFDRSGREAGRIALDELEALAVDPLGRAWVAAGERIYVLRGDQPVPVASQGAFAPAGSLAVDAAGRIYLTDRRGDRVGRVVPGAGSPELLRERRGAAISALAWSTGRLLALEERTGRVLDVRPDGTDVPVGTLAAAATPAFSIDAAGQIAVLDTRAGAIVLLGTDGQPRDRIALDGAGIGRVVALAFGPDGSLDVVDGAGVVTRFP
jgi:tetratricopeptide (TPR) repeat protein